MKFKLKCANEVTSELVLNEKKRITKKRTEFLIENSTQVRHLVYEHRIDGENHYKI